MVIVTLKKGEGRTLKSGGSWVYDNEIDTLMGSCADGDTVIVRDFDGYFLGYGYYNSHSKIRVRILSRREDEEIGEAFFERKVREAWAYRKEVVDTSSCRIIFSEADGLPGIVIDKFENVLVVESETLGIDKWKTCITEALVKNLEEDGIKVAGIYERSDAKVRELEGLERTKGFLSEPFDTNIRITENGVKYLVDVADGQKTGFFLDQKYNRRRIGELAKGKRVLDCFTHTGSFALNAGLGGASHVTAVDASEPAVLQARENAKLNGLENTVEFVCADVFDYLPSLEEAGEKFDLVILDPPAFTKSRSSIKNAVKGYREINIRGMKLLKNGGFLGTCSCSHYMDPELFLKTIREAARGAHKRLRQVYFGTQAPDHPILLGMEQSYYLKFYIFQVLDER